MDLTQILNAIVIPLLQKYPHLAAVVLFIGAAKMFVSPIQTFVTSMIQLTPSSTVSKDLEALMSSKTWQILTYAFHYITEIKLPGTPGTTFVSAAPNPVNPAPAPTDTSGGSTPPPAATPAA